MLGVRTPLHRISMVLFPRSLKAPQIKAHLCIFELSEGAGINKKSEHENLSQKIVILYHLGEGHNTSARIILIELTLHFLQPPFCPSQGPWSFPERSSAGLGLPSDSFELDRCVSLPLRICHHRRRHFRISSSPRSTSRFAQAPWKTKKIFFDLFWRNCPPDHQEVHICFTLPSFKTVTS